MPPVDGLQRDLGPAEWAQAGWEDASTVTRFVPRRFDAYLRILFPAGFVEDTEGPDPTITPVSWAAVAEWSGLPLHRRAGWASITVGPELLPDNEPYTHGPGGDVTGWDDTVVEVFAVGREEHERYWTLSEYPPDRPSDPIPPELEDAPTVTDPFGYAWHLFRLPLRQALNGIYCWPEDRSWFLANGGQDLPWMYLGGTAAVIGRIHDDDRLETLLVRVDEPIWYAEPWLESAARVTARQIVATGRGDIVIGGETRQYQIVPSTSPEVSYLRTGPPERETGLMVIGAEQINEDFLTDRIVGEINDTVA
jgi:hypothetical protein